MNNNKGKSMDIEKDIEIREFIKQFQLKYYIVVIQYVYTPEFNAFYLKFSFGINKASIREVLNLFKNDYEKHFNTKLKQHNKIPMAMGKGYRYTDVVFDFYEEKPKTKVFAVKKTRKKIKTTSEEVNPNKELLAMAKKISSNKSLK